MSNKSIELKYGELCLTRKQLLNLLFLIIRLTNFIYIFLINHYDRNNSLLSLLEYIMCTSFAYINEDSEPKVMFLHNRDLPKEGFKGHEIKVFYNKQNNNKVIGIYDYRSGGIPCGFEVKNKIYGGVANVSNYVGKKSRGILLLNILMKCNSLDDAISNFENELINGEYSSASYIIGNQDKVYIVENRASEVKIQDKKKFAVLTNQFEFIKNEYVNIESVNRKIFVIEYLKSKNKVILQDAFKIASTHEPVEICRHGVTLSSMIVQISSNLDIFYTLNYPHLGFNRLNIESI